MQRTDLFGVTEEEHRAHLHELRLLTVQEKIALMVKFTEYHRAVQKSLEKRDKLLAKKRS